MTTLEMMNEAEKTNNTYIASDMRYSKKLGFHDDCDEPWDSDAFIHLNEAINIDDWESLSTKEMTMEEVEEELGYKIKLISKNVNFTGE